MPDDLIERHQLQRLNRTRPPAGDVEYHFLYRNKPACLPVWNNGQLLVHQWAGYCPCEQLEAGNWTNRNPQLVSIPATFICDDGVWYPIQKMVSAVLAQKNLHHHATRRPLSQNYVWHFKDGD